MRTFTLDEAEALIPQIRESLLAMQDTKRQIDEVRGGLEHVARTSRGNGHVEDEDKVGEQRRRAEALVERLNERLSELNGLGVELKGLDDGLVDFPSERDGRMIYLCWKLGEESVRWWHELDEGFAGRQPL